MFVYILQGKMGKTGKKGKKITQSMSDALKIIPNSVMFYYCLWYEFYCIRR